MNISFQSNSKVLYNSKFLQLKSTVGPNGENNWFYAHRPNSKDVVVIAPIIHKPDGDSFVFLETRRPPIYSEGKAETCIEPVAGLVGDIDSGETVDEAAKKELLEEIGMKADKITIETKNMASSSGCLSETSNVAIADIYDDTILQEPVSDDGIIIDRHVIPLDKVNDWLKAQEKQGKAISAQALACLYYVQARTMKSEGNKA